MVCVVLTFFEGRIVSVLPSFFPPSPFFFYLQHGAIHLSLFRLLNSNVKRNSSLGNEEDDPVPR